MQAGANAKLSKATGGPFAATTIQVLIAGLLLLLVTAATGTMDAFGSLPGAPWRRAIGGIAIGGIAIAIYVASTIIMVPRLGATASAR